MIAKAFIWSTTHPQNLSHTAHLKAVGGVPNLCCFLSISSCANSSINSTCKDVTHLNQWQLLTMLIHQKVFWHLGLHALQNLPGSKINNIKSHNRLFCSSWCPVNSFTDVSFIMAVHVENTYWAIEEIFAEILQCQIGSKAEHHSLGPGHRASQYPLHFSWLLLLLLLFNVFLENSFWTL